MLRRGVRRPHGPGLAAGPGQGSPEATSTGSVGSKPRGPLLQDLYFFVLESWLCFLLEKVEKIESFLLKVEKVEKGEQLKVECNILVAKLTNGRFATLHMLKLSC